MPSTATRCEFTGAVWKESKWYVALCLELDVASQGRTLRDAKRMLADAVALYLESCFEGNVPYLRPVPKNEDPRARFPEEHLEVFPLRVDLKVHAVA